MAIDEDAVIEGVQQLGLEGGENGLILEFGVALTYGFADYYAALEYEAERLFQTEASDEFVLQAARELFIEAGHICGFNTLGGIMKSEAWDAVVMPMIESREDWIRGIIAVINALGWGRYEILELIPEEKLVVEVKNSYECRYYLEHYGSNADSAKCYLSLGVLSSIMNLIYEGNILEKPELTETFYHQLFKENKKFIAHSLSCRAKGDNVCTIEVSKIQ